MPKRHEPWGIAAVCRPMDVEVALPWEIMPGFQLRRATEREQDKIRPLLLPSGVDQQTARDFEWISTIPGDPTPGVPYRYDPMPRDQWRYHVIDLYGGTIE